MIGRGRRQLRRTERSTFFILTDKPEKAKFLTAEKRSWLAAKLAAERKVKDAVRTFTLWQALLDPKVLLLRQPGDAGLLRVASLAWLVSNAAPLRAAAACFASALESAHALLHRPLSTVVARGCSLVGCGPPIERSLLIA